MISGTFVGGNAKVIIPLRDKKSIYKYCQEQKYDTSLPLSCDSSIGLKYTLSFFPKSNEQSNYFILLNLNEDLLKMFIEKEMTLDEIVCIVEESEKLDDYELFLCCLYYFNNPRRIVDLEDGLKYFLQECNSNSDYIDIYKDIYGTYIESIPLYPFYINFKDFIENNYLAINFNNTEYIFEK